MAIREVVMGQPTRKSLTKGDAEAVLQAFGGAGRVIRRTSVAQFGNPADVGLRATIRPFSDSNLPFNGRHYCVEDWHVIVVAEISGGPGNFSRQDAENELSQVTHTFTLDGAPLTNTTRTSIRHFTDAGPFAAQFGLTWDKAFFFQEGRVMSPTELTVGQHSLSYTAVDPTGQFPDSITFFIDPAGQGACLQTPPL
jgi:hypothetical protein